MRDAGWVFAPLGHLAIVRRALDPPGREPTFRTHVVRSTPDSLATVGPQGVTYHQPRADHVRRWSLRPGLGQLRKGAQGGGSSRLASDRPSRDVGTLLWVRRAFGVDRRDSVQLGRGDGDRGLLVRCVDERESMGRALIGYVVTGAVEDYALPGKDAIDCAWTVQFRWSDAQFVAKTCRVEPSAGSHTQSSPRGRSVCASESATTESERKGVRRVIATTWRPPSNA